MRTYLAADVGAFVNVYPRSIARSRRRDDMKLVLEPMSISISVNIHKDLVC